MAAIAQHPPRSPGARMFGVASAAPFGRRAVAALFDLFVWLIVSLFVNFVFGVTIVTSGSPFPVPGAGYTSFTTITSANPLVLTLLFLAYFAFWEGLFGATPGKALLRLRVARRDGGRAGMRAILVRSALRLVDWLPAFYGVGVLFALTSPLRERLGDRLAGTLVMQAEVLPAPLLTPAQRRWREMLAGVVLAATLVGCGVFFYYGRPPLVVESMINTGALMLGGEQVTSYTLSAPHWGDGTITYHIHYTTANPMRACGGTFTLRWTGFLGGWEPATSEVSCVAPMK